MNQMSSQELNTAIVIFLVLFILFFFQKLYKHPLSLRPCSNIEEHDITKLKHGRQLGSVHPNQCIFRNNWWSSSHLHTYPLASSRSLPGRADTHCCVLLAILGLLLYVSNESSYWASTQSTNNDCNKRVLEPILGYPQNAQ